MGLDVIDVDVNLDENLLACTTFQLLYVLPPDNLAFIIVIIANSKGEALPGGGKVVATIPLGLSDYCNTTRIDMRLPDGKIHRFFEKVPGRSARRLSYGH